jgi:hypothetical protein
MADDTERLDSHEDMIRRLIQIAAHQDTINDDLRAIIARLDARMEAMEERQGQHETRADATLQGLTAAIDRLDATLVRWLERGTNGRDA